jgi:hypothetical protein
MALATYKAGKQYTFHDSAAAASLTVTLPTPAADHQWVIDNISGYALGTPTALKWEVYKNDGSTLIARVGGDITTGGGQMFAGVLGPICTTSGDGPKVFLTATGATAVAVNVNAHLENA